MTQQTAPIRRVARLRARPPPHAFNGDLMMHDDTDNPNDDKPPFRDLDEFFATMARRLGEEDRAWQACADRRCRRARCCRTANATCRNTATRTPATEEESALAMAELRTALEDRLRELGR